MARKGNHISGLDVGKMVRLIMFENGINKARLARKTDRTGTGIKQLIFNSSMQTYLVWELSLALNHNFFTDLAQQLADALEANDHRGPEVDTERSVTLSGEVTERSRTDRRELTAEGRNSSAEIAQLNKEIERLTQERDYLRKAVDLLSKGKT